VGASDKSDYDQAEQRHQGGFDIGWLVKFVSSDIQRDKHSVHILLHIVISVQYINQFAACNGNCRKEKPKRL